MVELTAPGLDEGAADLLYWTVGTNQTLLTGDKTGSFNLTTTGTGTFGTAGSVGLTAYGRTLLGGATDDTTSTLQVNGTVNFNDPSLTYGGINITSRGHNIQIGSGANATGNYSSALGTSAYAGGDYSFALGTSAYAGGNYSSALGTSAYAGGDDSSAFGSGANASGYVSSAFGYGAYAGGDYSFALGYAANANGNYSSALGTSAYANYSNSTVIGSDQSLSGNLNDNNAQGGVTLGGYNPTINSGESWLMILPGTTANTPRILIGASTIDDGTSALQVNGAVKSIYNTLDDGSGNMNVAGTVTANSLITSGGTSSQFVKGDGSLDSNIYLTAIAGVPKIVASADLTGKTSTQTAINYTTPNDSTTHSFRIGAYTSITAISAGTLTITATFTDENNTLRTITYFPMGLTTAGLTSTGFTAFAPINIRCKANTAITLVATFTGVSTTYDVGVTIESLY